jgi:hypothetical protein
MIRTAWIRLAAVGLLLSLATTAAAQDDMTALAEGLNAPRHLSYDSAGNLFIAEAGSGGEMEGIGPFGPATYGTSSQVTSVSVDGEQSIVVDELLSLDAGFGQIEGATSVIATEDSLWISLGLGPAEVMDGQYHAAVIQVDRESGEIGTVIDVGAYETENNPDGAEELVANPTDIALGPDGTLFIVDASGNALYAWTEADGLSVVQVWEPLAEPAEGEPSQSVPTSVAVGPDGSVYVGFLSGFPFPAGGARIEQWTDGELAATYEGLTLVTDVWVGAEGELYAVQFASGFGDQGYIPASGSIVSVSMDGITPVVEGLNFPYGIAPAPEGSGGVFAVTVDTYGAAPDTGSVQVVGSM